MTSISKTITLSQARNIPFNRLVLSQANVRQVKAGQSIEELSDDIALRGLIQSLSVRPVVDAGGKETGDFEVPAGGRRYRALEMLVKSKRLPKTAPVPCVVKDANGATSLEDDSLAENTHRAALHPLDQYRAFLTLRRQNLTEEEIAARYFVSVSVVRQRLRLAAVSPKLLDLYAEDVLSLDQLMAFSVTGDHQRQEEIWVRLKDAQSYQREAYHIRRLLTETAVAETDRRAVFVGTAAYEAAGGSILRDLFSASNGGWLQDVVLLDRLVGEKLQTLAEALQSETWKWIEVLPNVPFDHLDGMRKLTAIAPALTETDQHVLDSLKAEYEALNEEYSDLEDDLPDSVDQRLGELERAMEALEQTKSERFDPAEMRRAGVVVSIDRDGSPLYMRGYVRPEDELAAEPEIEVDSEAGGAENLRKPSATIISLGTPPAPDAKGEEEEGDCLRPLPEKLVLELTAFRTLALRDAVARNPRIAMTLLLHKLVGDIFRHRSSGACLQAWVAPPQLASIAPKNINDSVSATTMARRRELWSDIIPHDDQALWEWLDGETDEVRAELLAFCVSHGVDAVMERPNPNGSTTQSGIDNRMTQAMRLAQATSLDLAAAGWRATADSYLGRVPRPRILEAVREGCGERAVQLIDHLKKGDMVIEAERLLDGTGWLPEVLRSPEQDVAPVPEAAEEGLPAFLADDVTPDAPTDLNSVAAE